MAKPSKNHSFNVEFATDHGVDAAIVIGHIQFLTDREEPDDYGVRWVDLSAKKLKMQYPYWTVKQIRRILNHLLEYGIIVANKLSKNPYDRTNYYAFTEDSETVDNPMFPNGNMGDPKREDVEVPKREDVEVPKRELHNRVVQSCKVKLPLSAPVEANQKNGQAHSEFIEAWVTAFKAHFGVAYAFAGGKDGKAVKMLLNSTNRPAGELIAIAKQAWKRIGEYPFDSAASLATFNSRFNEIQAKLIKTNGTHHNGKPISKRVIGTYNMNILNDPEQMAVVSQFGKIKENGEVI